MAAEAIPFTREKPDAKIRILIIGDSTVVGTGSADSKLTVAGYLAADYPDAEIVNKGVNGTRTHALIERFSTLQSEHFDLVLIHTGGNDIVNFTSYEDLQKDLPQVLDLANKIGDKVVLLTSGDVGTGLLFPYGTRWIFTVRTKKVREMFMAITKEKNVHYVDLFRAPKDDPFAIDPDLYYGLDYFHPSAAGYRDWYDHVKVILDESGFVA